MVDLAALLRRRPLRVHLYDLLDVLDLLHGCRAMVSDLRPPRHGPSNVSVALGVSRKWMNTHNTRRLFVRMSQLSMHLCTVWYHLRSPVSLVLSWEPWLSIEYFLSIDPSPLPLPFPTPIQNVNHNDPKGRPRVHLYDLLDVLDLFHELHYVTNVFKTL